MSFSVLVCVTARQRWRSCDRRWRRFCHATSSRPCAACCGGAVGCAPPATMVGGRAAHPETRGLRAVVRRSAHAVRPVPMNAGALAASVAALAAVPTTSVQLAVGLTLWGLRVPAKSTTAAPAGATAPPLAQRLSTLAYIVEKARTLPATGPITAGADMTSTARRPRPAPCVAEISQGPRTDFNCGRQPRTPGSLSRRAPACLTCWPRRSHGTAPFLVAAPVMWARSWPRWARWRPAAASWPRPPRARSPSRTRARWWRCRQWRRPGSTRRSCSPPSMATSSASPAPTPAASPSLRTSRCLSGALRGVPRH